MTTIEQAISLHLNGALREAKDAYLAILHVAPNDLNALQFLGLLEHQQGNYQSAKLYLEFALSINGLIPQILNNYGLNEFQLGYFESAESAYSKAINLSPAYAEVYNNRGVLYLELKQYDKAYTDFAQAITLKQNYYEASINRAIVLKERKQFADALEALALIITQDPENITAYNNQGVVLVELKLLDQALNSFTEAIRINKNYVEAYNNRGNVLHRLKRYNEALADFEEAIRIDPDYADAYNNKGNALKELGYFDQALDSYDAALKINSRYFQAYNNKGNVLKDLKLFDEALKNYSKAIEINSEYPPALWNKGLVSLMLGNYQEGWKLYEWRKKTEELKEIFYKLPQPECLGTESIEGKRLLIYPEQGFGDFIQFVRYLPVVSSLKVDIILETPPQLFSLMTTIDAPVTLVRKGNPLPDFDAYCPIMSLPFIFKTDINNIPGKVPYLRPDMEKVSKWKAQLGESKKMRIGLVWSGAERHKNDHNRTMKLVQFAPLFELPIEWHSLQKEYRSSDAEQLSLFSFIHQHQNQLVDFSDTAALIECMDLIISVDTSVAHLAGAMNKKVWILIPFNPDFRWMLDRNDSPWYPSATLFRQTKRNDWESVIKQVGGCLSETINKRIDDALQLGVALHKKNCLEQARSIYEKILYFSPRNFEALQLLGVIEHQESRHEKAIKLFTEALLINAKVAAVFNNRGLSFYELGDLTRAFQDYVKSIELNSNYAEPHNNLGLLNQKTKLLDQALNSFTEAIRINKNYVEAYNNRGNVLHRLKRYNDALADFEEAIRIDPDYADAHNNKGNALKELGYFDQALDSYDAALKINSRYFQAYNNKGNVLKDLKLFDEALKNYSKAIEINSEYPPALWNKGLVSLMLGNYQEGWKLYEWRKKTEELKEIFYKLPQPECLETESIKGKRLLIYPEQGFGDFIQFVRYLPVVSSLKVDIILETPPQLFSLMTTIDAPVTLVRKGNPLPDFDAYCPIMSLPFIFKTDINDIPGKVPYLRPDMEKVSKWKAQLGESKKMRIGLVWSGAERHKNDHNRTMKLAQFAPLFELPIEWHSLQKEYRSSDAEQLSLFSFIHQHQNQLVDFSDTAALIECMDLIISVDTSVAHLAGAMNKKVWILIPFIPDFRWMLDRNDSPWYPSATLFRQTKRNDWEGVIKQVRGCLKNHVIERISSIVPTPEKHFSGDNLH